MPGMVGVIRNDGQPADVSASMRKLRHFPFYQERSIVPCPAAAFGVVYRKNQPQEVDWHFEGDAGVGALVSGTMIAAEPKAHVVRAAEVVDEYQREGFRYWSRFEGPFVTAILDLSARRLFLVNDRVGCLPIYWARSSGMFAFAPEAKGIFVHPEIDTLLSESGIVTFLSAGYCLGNQTLFEGVLMLEPGTLLSVSLDTLEVERTRLWKMVFEPAESLQHRRTAEDCLCQAVIAAHRTTLCDKPSRVSVMLSGGWDSRGILAALDRTGQTVHVAQTWGLRDDIRDSDAFVARQLAEEFEVPFAFCPYDTDTFVANARSWTYISELANDNFG